MKTSIDHRMMQRALRLAQDAAKIGEIPVGAVVGDTNTGNVFGQAHNQSIMSTDPTAHAEILALRKAAKHLGNYRLPGLSIWVTLEPCTMCAGAIAHARLDRIIFATPDPKTGAVANGVRLFDSQSCPHKPQWQQGPFTDDCSEILKRFFAKRRQDSSLTSFSLLAGKP